ncbi:hypothetical protein [uncultured Akkermansia sp.]|uniref:hypothetical protein n=1 Tax=uncultured Akkermansia sp. TaxID=512294 RepID=UPI00265D1C82|nr:hypothetical protein [uncultured Akkermansia sp.]
MWKIRFPVERGIQGRILSNIILTGRGRMQDAGGAETAIFGKVGPVPEEVFRALKTGRERGEGRSSNGPGEKGSHSKFMYSLRKIYVFFKLLVDYF